MQHIIIRPCSTSLSLAFLLLSVCQRDAVVGFSVDFSRRSLLFVCATTTSFSCQRITSSSSLAATAMNTRSNIRWGIVGLGDVTEKKSGPPFYKADGCELVAVMRRTPGQAAAWAQRVPGGTCVGYDNLDDFLQHPGGLDAVYVATRPGTHVEVCRRVAQAGKTIYVEKPVGRCAAETQAIADLTKVSGKPVYTAYISRAYERTQAVRQLLKDGAIGDCVTSVEYNLIGTGGARGMDTQKLPWRLIASEAGGGLIMDVGCHIIDRIDYLCGPLENVKGQAKNLNSPRQKVEDFVEFEATIGAFEWAAIPARGAKVKCCWDFSGQSGEEEKDELVINGPKGSLRLVGMSPSLPIFIQDVDGKVVEEKSFATPENTAQRLIQAVTNELLGVSSADFISRTDHALRTSKVIDSALLNYYADRNVGFWEKEDAWPGRPSASRF